MQREARLDATALSCEIKVQHLIVGEGRAKDSYFVYGTVEDAAIGRWTATKPGCSSAEGFQVVGCGVDRPGDIDGRAIEIAQIERRICGGDGQRHKRPNVNWGEQAGMETAGARAAVPLVTQFSLPADGVNFAAKAQAGHSQRVAVDQQSGGIGRFKPNERRELRAVVARGHAGAVDGTPAMTTGVIGLVCGGGGIK